MNKLHLSAEASREIVYEDSEDYEIIYDKVIGHTRWSINHEIVIRELATEKCYITDYFIAATEMQDERPFDYTSPKWIEVKPVEKLQIVYEIVEG